MQESGTKMSNVRGRKCDKDTKCQRKEELITAVILNVVKDLVITLVLYSEKIIPFGHEICSSTGSE
jgi:hypothetical protein